MYRMRAFAAVAASIVTSLAAVAAAGAADTDTDPEPSQPPLGPPVVHEDPLGDVEAGLPDLTSCGVSEPWQSLVAFTLEFAEEPPLSYDLETMTTDELWVAVSTKPGALFDDGDIEYAMIVHGATLPQDEATGGGLYDTTQPEGQEVFWRVVDVEVEGPVLTLSIDHKLLGDPDVIYFQAAVAAEGEDDTGGYDVCPDEETGPGEYVLFG